MNLEDAIAAHAKWKVKFRTAIDQKETLDVATIAKDNCCDFGKWLHGSGRTEAGSLPDYPVCIKEHATFHTEAAKVATAINAKKFAEAEAMIGTNTAYGKASNAVGTAIMRLRKSMK